MELTDGDPRSIGPWRIEALNFREPGRTSYAATTGSLAADILVVEVSPASRAGFRANLERAKSVFSLEMPRVLDASLDHEPRWVASDKQTASRLSEHLETQDHLEPQQWAELAKTALIGCAALRANGIKAFQLSPNTFVIDSADIHLSEVWAGSYHPNPLYPDEGKLLNELTTADDLRAIGRLLAISMGAAPELTDFSAASLEDFGYTDEHLEYVRRLTAADPRTQPSTEVAIKTIPGRDPSWTVPIFALDKPGRVRAQRHAQRGILWGAAAVVGAGLIAGLGFLLNSNGGDSSDGGTESDLQSTSEEQAALIREVRLTFAQEGADPVVMEVADTYDFSWCYPEANLNTDEIPDRLVLQSLDGEKWTTDRSVDVEVVTSPQCSGDELAVSLTAPLPTVLDEPFGWTSCSDYRVLIPRLSSDRRAPIRYCLQVRAYDPSTS